ncbi:MAG: outer membrane protein [Xanthobacteraceae bacterium]
MFGGTHAFAADVAVKRSVYKAPPPKPVFSWSGCYVGAHVGGLWANMEWRVGDPASPFFGQVIANHDIDGFLGGVQGGCDYQFANGFVIGVAGDYAWVNADSNALTIQFAPTTNHAQVNSLSSVTGRIGYAWDRFLGYAKGGIAWERNDYEYLNPAGAIDSFAKETRSAWTLGVGGEYAFTNFLSGFVEWNYYDFGSRDVTFRFPVGGGIDTMSPIDESKNVVKAGINLRFGAGKGPVVAKN